jgi:hypothetical protein
MNAGKRSEVMEAGACALSGCGSISDANAICSGRVRTRGEVDMAAIEGRSTNARFRRLSMLREAETVIWACS